MALLSPSCNTEIVHEQEPILVEPALEHLEDQLLKVLWTVGRAKGKTSGQPATARREHGHLLTSFRLVVNLVEPFLEVTYRNEQVAGHSALNVIGIRNEEEFPDRHFVELSVVDHHPAATLNGLIGRLWLGRECGESPFRRSLLQLAPLHVLCYGILNPFGVRPIETEELDPHWGSFGNQSVSESLHRGARSIRQPHAP